MELHATYLQRLTKCENLISELLKLLILQLLLAQSCVQCMQDN